MCHHTISPHHMPHSHAFLVGRPAPPEVHEVSVWNSCGTLLSHLRISQAGGSRMCKRALLRRSDLGSKSHILSPTRQPKWLFLPLPVDACDCHEKARLVAVMKRSRRTLEGPITANRWPSASTHSSKPPCCIPIGVAALLARPPGP